MVFSLRCTSFHNFFFNFWIFLFVILVPFEILSHYPNIDSSHWLRVRVLGRRKSVQGKAYGLNGFDTFFSHISTEFLGFGCICFFLGQWHVLMSSDKLWKTNSLVVTWRHNLAYLMAYTESYWILWCWYYGFSQIFRDFNVFFIVIRIFVMSYRWLEDRWIKDIIDIRPTRQN